MLARISSRSVRSAVERMVGARGRAAGCAGRRPCRRPVTGRRRRGPVPPAPRAGGRCAGPVSPAGRRRRPGPRRRAPRCAAAGDGRRPRRPGWPARRCPGRPRPRRGRVAPGCRARRPPRAPPARSWRSSAWMAHDLHAHPEGLVDEAAQRRHGGVSEQRGGGKAGLGVVDGLARGQRRGLVGGGGQRGQGAVGRRRWRRAGCAAAAASARR